MTLAVRLACQGFARSLRFYTDVLGFVAMRLDAEARVVELERDGVQIELAEGDAGEVADLAYPFGRGVTLIVWVHDAEAVYASVHAYGARLHAPLHEAMREEDGVRTAHARFEVIDPDGYRIRFCQSLRDA